MEKPDFDVLVIGAGPIGLLAASALALRGFSVGVVDPTLSPVLADPKEDGREIALAPDSIATLKALTVWDEIPANEKFPLRAARVFDRDLRATLDLDPGPARGSLGVLVGNSALRRAAWARAVADHRITIETGTRLVGLAPGEAVISAAVEDGEHVRTNLHARLVVAADGRFSQARRMAGIATEQYDFGKSMLVCRMRHERDHESEAWEWFGLHQTLARLPLAAKTSSIVLTLAPREMARVAALPAEAFAREIEQRFAGRLGAMELLSERHVYPLVATYAERFIAERFALVGDAAIGMHPVTAHGMNFGLTAVDLLSRAVGTAASARGDIGSPFGLRGYARRLRISTRPLYLATLAIARLYSDPRPPTLVVRELALRAASLLPRVPRITGLPGPALHGAAILSHPLARMQRVRN